MDIKMEDKISSYEQRSEKWFKARIGKFTASNFSDLMKSGRKKEDVFSQAAMSLIYDKLAEIVTGQSKQIFGDALEWGVDNEAYAIALYEQSKKRKVSSIGFVPLSGYEGYCGGSPDGLIDEGKGIIEVKCPYNSSNHIWTLANKSVPIRNYDKYYTQMQLNMLCTGAEYCDFISFDPRAIKDEHKICVIRYKKDEAYIAKIIERLDLAINELIKIGDNLNE